MHNSLDGLCFCRQGDEWYRNRVILVQRTLKPKAVLEYLSSMNDVANDFTEHLKHTVDSATYTPNLELIIFKWALECMYYLILNV